MTFSKETLDFLVENRMRNSREWFNENRDRYLKLVREPLLELADKLAPVALAIDPKLVVDPKRNGTVSRINRDTRFSKDKSLYRDVCWVGFCRDKKSYDCPPGFFFEFSPDGLRYGCGFYSARPKLMEAARSLILRGDKTFLAAKKAYEKQSLFGLEGETYKRPHFPDQPEDLRSFLERRVIDFIHNSRDFDLLYSERLADVLADGFRALEPMYAFMAEAVAELERK